MNTTEPQKTAIEQAGEELFNFAVEREDVKWLLAQHSKDATVKSSTLEYELQILKIISVGWAITYYLEGTPRRKETLAQGFWSEINIFSKDLSETTGLMIGQDIDYFEILKSRLDTYITAMAQNEQAQDPTVVIGPEFAALCGDRADIFSAMAGSKMFNTTINRVRRYLEALKLR
jgi:hypothetical protein